jgi:molybdopterin/thiamine biosynthesis adenylyltransferase
MHIQHKINRLIEMHPLEQKIAIIRAVQAFRFIDIVFKKTCILLK